ncbi:DUF2652 domain-containing protein [Pedobacter sp.]|uniref:DUF2652 domain-containing protein n=1 Tax=Pedobacter sp. TaxID=1411316 RepID=UPI003C5E2A65
MSSTQATIFIVDISGYSRFVNEMDFDSGVSIVSELLGSIMESNRLSFTVSELEGDAVLFYKFGTPNTVEEILRQFEDMLFAFDQVIQRYRLSIPQVGNLSVKVVVHYGKIGLFQLKGFSKLYGAPVITAHRLLKNKVNTHTYALITQAFIEAQARPFEGIPGVELCESYDVGRLCFTYFPFAPQFPVSA